MPAALAPGDVVMVMGLESRRDYNYQAAVVLDEEATAEGRLAVRLLHRRRREAGPRTQLSVRRRHLRLLDMPGSSEGARRRRGALAESCAADRAAVLTRVVWERQLELRVAAPFLRRALQDEDGGGLCQNIASFFEPRATLALTTGFANGRVVPDWSCVKPTSGGGGGGGGGFEWRPVHDGGAQQVWGAAGVKDGIVRIDCAVVDIGLGRFVIAGGCADHPQRVRGRFFRSAFVYDAMAHAVAPLPDMPHARHGCGGACLDLRGVRDGGLYVFVFGGEYVNGVMPLSSQCHYLDLKDETWHALTAQGAVDTGGQMVAFVPVAAAGGRLVAIVNGQLWALDPLRVGGWQWRRCLPDAPASLGTSAQACVAWGNEHLVVSQGRGYDDDDGDAGDGSRPACHVHAVTFCHPPGMFGYGRGTPSGLTTPSGATTPGRRMPPGSLQTLEWVRWTDLGPVDSAAAPSGRVGGDLAVVHDRLYICGGVDEQHGRFDDTVARWDGARAALQTSAPAFNPERLSPFVRGACALAAAQTIEIDVYSTSAELSVRGVHSTEVQKQLPPGMVESPDCQQGGHCLAVVVTSLENSAAAASVQVRRLRPTQGGGWEVSAAESLLSAGLNLVLIDQGLLVIKGLADRREAVVADLGTGAAKFRGTAHDRGTAAREPQSWTVVAGLKMPAAMHAHSAITVPLLPREE